MDFSALLFIVGGFPVTSPCEHLVCTDDLDLSFNCIYEIFLHAFFIRQVKKSSDLEYDYWCLT